MTSYQSFTVFCGFWIIFNVGLKGLTVIVSGTNNNRLYSHCGRSWGWGGTLKPGWIKYMGVYIRRPGLSKKNWSGPARRLPLPQPPLLISQHSIFPYNFQLIDIFDVIDWPEMLTLTCHDIFLLLNGDVCFVGYLKGMYHPRVYVAFR